MSGLATLLGFCLLPIFLLALVITPYIRGGRFYSLKGDRSEVDPETGEFKPGYGGGWFPWLFRR